MTELPNNGGTTPVDFTDNELLLHGFETVSATPTYTADLSTSSWTTGGTGTQVTIDTTNEEIDFSVPSTNSHLAQAYYDLTTVSNTNWIIRSQLDIDTVTQGSAVNDVFFSHGIGSINSNINDSQDFLGLMIRVDNTKTDIFAVETDGSAPNNETTTLFTRQAQAETLYVEMKRDSATSFTINLYSDSGYSTLLESKTITIPSSLTGLRYIKVTSIQGFSDSELIGSVSNIKFYNDMTTTTEDIIPDKSTNNISVTANAGTTTTGQISDAISTPNLEVTSSLLPDATDSFTVGSWVKQALTRDSTLDGTQIGGVTTSATGKVDSYAWDFDGSNDYVDLPSNPFDNSNSYTLSTWVNTDTNTEDNIFFKTGDGSNGDQFFGMNSAGKFYCVSYGTGTTVDDIYDSATSSVGVWYHVACVRDSTANTLTLYVNGVQKAQDTSLVTSGAGYFTNTDHFIGARLTSGTAFWNGQIDQTLTYSRALSSSEISSIYNSGSGTTTVPTTNLVMSYNFEQTGSTLENQIYNPPTNTKLFGFTNSNGGAVFNVGTTSANFVKLATAPSYSTNFGTSTGWTVTDSEISIDTANNRIYYNGDLDTTDTSAYYDYYTSQGANLQTWTVDIDITKISNNNLSHRTEFLITDTLGGVGVAQNAIGITTQANNNMNCRYYDGTATSTDIGTHTTSNGVTNYVRLSYDGTTFTCDLMNSSRTSVSLSHSATVSGVDMSNARYIIISDRDNTNSSVNNVVIEFENLAVTPTNSMESTIISATGLTDNTSDFQHYALTRDGSSWTLYQNGQSVATATDSTDLGTVSGSHKINLDGAIDEYFIDSTALTSNEIQTVYDMGTEPTQIATTGTTPSYDDSGVVGGNTYYYYVKSTNAVGDSGFSAQATGLAGTPPDAPTGLSATIQNTATAPRDVFLQWSAPTNVGSGTLTGFEIWRDGSLVTTVGLISSYVDIVPTAGTYTYTVKAVSTHGTSVDSNSAQVTTPNLPDAPQGLTLSIDNPDPNPLTVTVTVSPPLNDGGSAVGSYNIYTSSDDVTYTLQASNVSNPSNITVPSAGVWYFKASAVNGVGEGNLSPSNLIGTPTVPSAVSDLAFTSSTPTTLSVNWTAPDNGGSAITTYKMFVDGIQVDTTTFTTYTFTGLTTKTNYDFTVVTTNNVGDSNSSNTLNETVWGVPDAVTNLTASSTLSSITLNYDAAVPYGYPVTGYKLERESPVGGGFTVLSANIGIVTTYTDTGLSPVVEYNYRITPLSSIGDGVSATINYTTLPPAPTGLTASSTITGNMDLSWTAPSPSTGVTGYHIQRADGVGNAYATIVADTGNTNTTYTDTGLTQGIVYVYRVAAITPFGESNYSNTYSMTTYYLPNAVTDLTVTTNNLLQFVLNWSQPTLYGTFTGYQLNYTTPAGVPQTIYSSSIQDTNTKISGFDPTVEFSFRVAPITIHGTNATGNIVTGQVTSQIEIGDITVSGQATPDTRDIVFTMESLDNTTNVITATFDPALELNCEISQPALGTTQEYPSISETLDGVDAYHEFTINNSAGNIVEIDCHDTTDNTITASYTLRTDEVGNNTTDSIISIQQIKDFTDGTLGGSDSIGGVSLIILAVGIIGMIGFNRTHPAIGIGMFVVVMGGARYFNLIGDIEGIIGIIALIIVLGVAGAERITR
uniref:ORF42 n=1 Tax=Nitrosopumilaceae spindle-shaped virus TaxID=3065433 RepID=A0AAT9JFF7_9VIRU